MENIGAIREHLVGWLRSQEGTVETPKNSNIVPYNDWYYENKPDSPWLHRTYHKLKEAENYRKLGSMYAYCGTFCAYGLHFTLKDFGLMLPTSLHDIIGYVPSAQNWLEDHGCRVDFKDMLPGDIVIMDFQNDRREDHIGFARSPYHPSYCLTIEGNTSSSDKGSQDNGGGVWKKARNWKIIEGVYSLEKILEVQ